MRKNRKWVGLVYCPEKRCADFYFAENYAYSYELMLSKSIHIRVRDK